MLGAVLNKTSMTDKVGSVREMQLKGGVSGAQMENHPHPPGSQRSDSGFRSQILNLHYFSTQIITSSKEVFQIYYINSPGFTIS